MENDNLKLVFVGDFCSYTPERQKIGTKLQVLLDQSDLNVVNFEGCLQYGQLHTAGRFYLKQSHDSPRWLIDHGFNVVNLANNHAYDWGEVGLRKTQEAFADVIALGCGYWNEVYQVRFVELKGFRIGLFFATSADLSSLKDKWDDGTKFGCPWINHVEVDEILKRAKERCDYLVVMAHAGVEYMPVPLPEWRDRYRHLIDIGADIIIATHPHVPQGMEYYKDKAIFYSLGNFCFDKGEESKIPYWNNGVVVCIEISSTGLVVRSQLTRLSNHEVEIDQCEESQGYFKNLCALLENDAHYVKTLNGEVLKMYHKYEDWLLEGLQAYRSRPRNIRILYRFLRSFVNGQENYRVALHQIREESTRWILARAYKLLSNTDL